METEKKDFLTWCKQNNLLSKEKFEELKTDVSKHLQYQLKCTVEIKREPIYKDDPVNQTKLIQEYLQAVETVKKDKKLKTEEKLEKLLTPLVNLSKIVFPTNYASHLPFINEDINLKNELDRDNLVSNSKKYFIVDDTESREFGVLRTRSRNIYLSKQYLAYLSFCRQRKFVSEDEFYREIYPKAKRNDHRSVNDKKNSMEELIEPGTNCYSLNDIYEDWLLTLTPEKMKSNDLLDRILVTFTIKRALNGEGKAIDKLCSLFQDNAEATVVKKAARKMLHKDIPDIKSEIKPLLKHIISGYSPSEILEHVTKKSGGDFFGIPLCVKLFYVYLLLKVVPERLSKIIENPTIALKDPFEILVLINPISYINATTDWEPLAKKIQNINKVDSASSTKTKRRFKFNSFSFRPSNKTNLYTWLFGTKRNPMQGRFCQAMDEELSRYYKMEGKTNKKENDSTDESNGKDIGIANSQNYEELIRQQQRDYSSSLKGKESFNSNYDCDTSTEDERVKNIKRKGSKTSDEIEREKLEEKKLEEIKVELSKKKVCERDIKIVISKLKGFSYTELGKINNISRRQVINIFNKYRQFLKELIPEDSG